MNKNLKEPFDSQVQYDGIHLSLREGLAAEPSCFYKNKDNACSFQKFVYICSRYGYGCIQDILVNRSVMLSCRMKT